MGQIYLENNDTKKAIMYIRNANISLESIFPSESHPLRFELKYSALLCNETVNLNNKNNSAT